MLYYLISATCLCLYSYLLLVYHCSFWVQDKLPWKKETFKQNIVLSSQKETQITSHTDSSKWCNIRNNQNWVKLCIFCAIFWPLNMNAPTHSTLTCWLCWFPCCIWSSACVWAAFFSDSTEQCSPFTRKDWVSASLHTWIYFVSHTADRETEMRQSWCDAESSGWCDVDTNYICVLVWMLWSGSKQLLK